MADPKHIVRTAGTDWSQVWRGRHPFNPASEMRIVQLGGQTGLKRIGVNLIRIPPGKESFIPHAHSTSEEFVFVLEGAGEAVLDGVGHAVGPGDFVGFPIDGVVHLQKRHYGNYIMTNMICKTPLNYCKMSSQTRLK